MEDNNWVFVVLIIFVLLFWRDHHKLSSRIEYLQYQVSSLEEERDEYEDALDQANSNIEDAQYYAWSSYDDMGYALDNLETVNP
ncbi:MAG: hypothetical protein M3M85_02290 [bacterium]|nr:hypothetical protein [bacterium]